MSLCGVVIICPAASMFCFCLLFLVPSETSLLYSLYPVPDSASTVACCIGDYIVVFADHLCWYERFVSVSFLSSF